MFFLLFAASRTLRIIRLPNTPEKPVVKDAKTCMYVTYDVYSMVIIAVTKQRSTTYGFLNERDEAYHICRRHSKFQLSSQGVARARCLRLTW